MAAEAKDDEGGLTAASSKILLVHIRGIRHITYSITAIARTKVSYSALLNSLDRFALALRAVFLGTWARVPRVNNIALVTAKLLGDYSPPSPPASAAYGFNYRVASRFNGKLSIVLQAIQGVTLENAWPSPRARVLSSPYLISRGARAPFAPLVPPPME